MDRLVYQGLGVYCNMGRSVCLGLWVYNKIDRLVYQGLGVTLN